MDQQSENKIKSNLETQLSEVESLQSMFCNPGEIRVEDPATLIDMQEFIDKKVTTLPPYLDMTINLLIENYKFELCITLPHDYPYIEPDIFVRNHKLNRTQHTKLNKDLIEYISNIDRGEPCIFSAISWLQDNISNYIDSENENLIEPNEKDESLIRYWIYSHHIYSKTKRREILNLASSLKITGFCMPGKPGIICVEGVTSDCNEWWQIIKSMNWKRIFCKVTEECKDDKENFLKFDTFVEVIFQNSGVKCNHMDMGELHKFLETHKCAYVFKDLFGVEAKNSSF